MNPENKLNFIHTIARFSIAGTLIYHGLVPKILWLDETELLIVQSHSFFIPAEIISLSGGVLEIILGLLILFMRKHTVFLYISIALFTVLLVDVTIVQPQLLIKAFNPVTINVSSIILCMIAIITQDNK